MRHTLYEVQRARRTATAARARLTQTVSEVRARLAPEALAHEAWAGAKAQARGAAADAVEQVRARPLATLALCAAVLAFVAREPLARALQRRLFERKRNDSEIDKEIRT